MRSLFTLLLLSVRVYAVSEQTLDAFGHLESRNNPAAVGDGTRARGEFQFWRATWNDCSRVRAARGLPTWPYQYAHHPAVARAYARSWLEHLEARLTRALGRKPGVGELYAAHNLGFSGFASRGFRLSNCPEVTRRNVRWLSLHAAR